MRFKHLAAAAVATLVTSFCACAQSIEWKAKAVKISINQYKVELSAFIPDGYHMYDFGPYDEFGPVASEVSFEPGKGASLSGGVKAPAARRYKDAMYGIEVGVYEGKAVFIQEVKGKAGSGVRVRAKAMMCSGMSCIPPKETVLNVTLGK